MLNELKMVGLHQYALCKFLYDPKIAVQVGGGQLWVGVRVEPGLVQVNPLPGLGVKLTFNTFPLSPEER